MAECLVQWWFLVVNLTRSGINSGIKQLDVWVRDGIDQVVWRERIHPNVSSTFQRRPRKRKFLTGNVVFCLLAFQTSRASSSTLLSSCCWPHPPCSQVHPPCCCRHPSLTSEVSCFSLSTRTKVTLQESSRPSALHWDCWGSQPGGLKSYQALRLGSVKTAIVGLSRSHHISQSNKSLLDVYSLCQFCSFMEIWVTHMVSIRIWVWPPEKKRGTIY